jgi:hypothetical protein
MQENFSLFRMKEFKMKKFKKYEKILKKILE